MKSRRAKKVCWDQHRVRQLRDHLRMTQQELADELGTRQQTVSEWERGAYTPRGASVTVLSIVAERSGFRYIGPGVAGGVPAGTGERRHRGVLTPAGRLEEGPWTG